MYHSKLKNLFKTIIIEGSYFTSKYYNTQNKSKQNDFFHFDSDSENDNNQCNEPRAKAKILISYFFTEESKDLTLLEKYPEKKVFIKYNTPLPSSVSVERFFSYTTITNQPKANRLSNQMFGKCVLLF